MRTTTSYKHCDAAFTIYEPAIIDSIVKAAAPESIFLLGLNTHKIQANNIFNGIAVNSTFVSDIWLLVLISSFAGKSRHEWQDKIEAHCNMVLPATTIVVEAPAFKEWIMDGDRFAVHVLQQSACIYSITGSPCSEITIAAPVDAKEMESALHTAINKAKEFLAGAELYRVRKQYNLSAFMLHQSAEQSLLMLLFITTGLRINTHNVERLLRCASFLAGAPADIFHTHRQEDKRLIKLLQKAYIDTRYSKEYTIHYGDLWQLTEKIRDMADVVSDACRQMITSITHHHEKQYS